MERLVSSMNRTERMDIFLKKLKEDSSEYSELNTTGYTLERKRDVIRSLMNIRMPRDAAPELLTIQDEYLQDELAEKGTVSLSDIPTALEQYGASNSSVGEKSIGGAGVEVSYMDRISIWQGDITRLKVGAIVNAANSQMLGCFVPCHRCIDNAIHSAAGMQLRAECHHIISEKRMRYGREYEEPVGTATLTKAYNLPCDYVIHTVGPIVYGELTDALCQDLRNCYEAVLECCVTHGIKSVAFCCISTGEFHFPNEEAAKIALATVTDFMKTHEDFFERIIFNVFKECDLEIYRKLVSDYCMYT